MHTCRRVPVLGVVCCFLILLSACAEFEEDTPITPLFRPAVERAMVARSVQQGLMRGEPQRVVVELRDGASVVALRDVVAVERDLGELPSVSLTLRDPAQLDAVLKTGAVRRVWEDVILVKHDADAMSYIEQPTAAQRGLTGKGVGVAVLDTGVDFQHADFGGCVAAGVAGCKVVFSKDFAPDDAAADVDGHGSNVAATVLAAAPDAEIVSLDVFDGDTARASDVLAAIDWVIRNQQTYNIGVINLSLGSGKFTDACSDNVFATALKTARTNGILPVSSSGNDGFTDAIGQPACVPDVLSVGAVYDGALGPVAFSSCADASSTPGQVACFTNASGNLDIVAPGVQISGAGYVMSGTSQAAPSVAGAAAVLLEAYPNETIEQIADRLILRAPSVVDARNGLSFARLSLKQSLDAQSDDITPGDCAVSVTPERLDVAFTGASFEVNIAAEQGCSWEVTHTVSWVTVRGGVGEGSGSFDVEVAPNSGGLRGAVVHVGGATLDIVQAEATQNRPRAVMSMGTGSSMTNNRLLTVRFDVQTPTKILDVCIGVNGECGEWAAFAQEVQVELPAQEGYHFLQAQLRDEFGRLSDPIEGRVLLDWTAPEDVRVRLIRREGAVELSWPQSLDATSRIGHYVLVARDDRMPTSCSDTLAKALYQGRERLYTDVRETSTIRYYRVCAVDEAGNASEGFVVAGGPK